MGAAPAKMASFGLLAEFDNPQALVDAADRARREGFVKMEGYSPFPVEGLREALGQKRTLMPVAIFFGGITGTISGFMLQTLTSGGLPAESMVQLPAEHCRSPVLLVAGLCATDV
jgi:hypothetical protein